MEQLDITTGNQLKMNTVLYHQHFVSQINFERHIRLLVNTREDDFIEQSASNPLTHIEPSVTMNQQESISEYPNY
jgi:hypothetical protein